MPTVTAKILKHVTEMWSLLPAMSCLERNADGNLCGWLFGLIAQYWLLENGHAWARLGKYKFCIFGISRRLILTSPLGKENPPPKPPPNLNINFHVIRD